MPDLIKVIFRRVYVRNDADTLGSGEFYFIASVDGAPVGDRRRIFEAVEGRWITLPEAQWSSAPIDVRNKRQVTVRFQGKDEDTFSDEDLGTITHILRPPWSQRNFRHHTRYYLIEWSVELAVEGRFGRHAPNEVFACRENAGSASCTTVSGNTVVTRLEICPVSPTPANADLPPRPALPAGTQGDQRDLAYAFLAPGLSINTISNPAVIPILTHAQATTQTAALIQATYYHPNTLGFQENDERLVWSYRSLAANATLGFVAPGGGQPGRGLRVFVYGVGNQEGEVLLEVRFRGALLATYRALVRRIRRVRCRINILNGPNSASRPRSTPENVRDHLTCANILLRQMGVELELDPDLTVWNNAVPVPGFPGIFRIQVNAGITRNVNWAMQTPAGYGYIPATRLNYNQTPGPNVPYVINIAYIRSVIQIQHQGTAHRPLGLATDHPANGAGNNITDNGTPSTSWVRPSGVPPDGAAGAVRMNLDPARQRNPNLAALWVRDFADPSDPDEMGRYGYVIAHEMGHILGLHHRGRQGGQNLPDGVGHPPDQNVMFSDEDTFGQDFDILQARAAHRSPVLLP